MEVEKIRKIAVIGAGEMGHGIAELASLKGYKIAMVDIKKEFIDRGMERIRWSLGKFVERRQLSPKEAEEALQRITATVDLHEAVRNADFIIEAVTEDLELKKRMFQELDRIARKDVILASNTSGLSITAMGRVTGRPQRVVGMHFFNPAVLMKLVEIVKGEDTSDETIRETQELSKRLGKTPILCRKDIPGFITTRTIAHYMNEAAWIHHEEGIPKETIDSAMKFRVGFPMGPFELADQVGIDLLHYGQKKWGLQVPPPFEQLMKEGKLGKKVGRGFYDYMGGAKPRIAPEEGKDFDVLRIIAPVINEAAGLVEIGVATPEEIDEAMRLGTAFPKGPLAMADEIGIDKVIDALRRSKRHSPSKILEDMVAKGELGRETGKGFYTHKGAEEKRKFETIIVDKDLQAKITTLTLNRPDRLNTISPEMVKEISMALDELKEDENTRCLILKGAGDKAFCAGADITSFSGADKSHLIWDFSKRIHETFAKLEGFPKPTIAAIDGYALGGGCEMALACDFRIASKRSALGQTEVRLGLIPGAGGTQRLTRIVGLAKAKELVLLGSRISAEEGEKCGLVHKAVENEAFWSEVLTLAEKLTKGPPIALKIAKQLLNRGAQVGAEMGLEMEALAFGIVTSTEDVIEGISSFLSKKEPEFKGK